VGILMVLLGAVMPLINSSLRPEPHAPPIPVLVVTWMELPNVEGPLVLLGAGLVQPLLTTAVAMRLVASPIRSLGNSRQATMVPRSLAESPRQCDR
jgi:hypothetical protein